MLTLTPAYGRDYTSKQAVINDWMTERDFVINQIGHPFDGKYCNRQQLIDGSEGKQVMVRYKRLTMVVVLDVAKDYPVKQVKAGKETIGKAKPYNRSNGSLEERLLRLL